MQDKTNQHKINSDGQYFFTVTSWKNGSLFLGYWFGFTGGNFWQVYTASYNEKPVYL